MNASHYFIALLRLAQLNDSCISTLSGSKGVLMLPEPPGSPILCISIRNQFSNKLLVYNLLFNLGSRLYFKIGLKKLFWEECQYVQDLS